MGPLFLEKVGGRGEGSPLGGGGGNGSRLRPLPSQVPDNTPKVLKMLYFTFLIHFDTFLAVSCCVERNLILQMLKNFAEWRSISHSSNYCNNFKVKTLSTTVRMKLPARAG